MSKTIVQKYGPIYGEPVNGTVMGRPNGSVYVPPSNKISISIDSGEYMTYADASNLCVCDSSGQTLYVANFHVVAESQDLASNIQVQIFDDSAMTNMVAHRDWYVGQFQFDPWQIGNAVAGITDGTTLYVRAQLMNNGTPVSTSDTLEFTMVVPA